MIYFGLFPQALEPLSMNFNISELVFWKQERTLETKEPLPKIEDKPFIAELFADSAWFGKATVAKGSS